MKRQLENRLVKKTALFLIIGYVGISLLRFLLALFTSAYPLLYLDEYLYYSLARSIATEGKLLFRGQLADYSYILYPLVLSPVYLFFRDGANFYRLIQLWNILIMTTAIFPIYGLCCAMIEDKKKAFLLTLAFMLLPDFILGQIILSEAIIYPLFHTLLYCAYRYIVTKDSKQLLFMGGLGALLYYAKPGSVLPSIVFLLVFLIRAIREKNQRQAVFCLAGAAVFCAVYFAFQFLIHSVFGYQGDSLSIYENQIAGKNDWHLDVFFQMIPAYLYYFILACGIIGFVYPLKTYRHWQKEQKLFAVSVLICLLAMIVGTCWVINRHEYATKIVHLRYIAMYIPLTLLFCFLPAETESKPKGKALPPRKPAMLPLALLIFTAVCAVIYGVGSMDGFPSCYPFLSLCAILLGGSIPTSMQPVCVILVILCCAACYFLLENRKNKMNLPRICVWVMIPLMLVNGISGYASLRETMTAEYARQAAEFSEIADGGEYIYVYTDELYPDFGLDVNNRKNTRFVTLNDLFDHLYTENGCYVPFVPRGMRGVLTTETLPDTDFFVFDKTSYTMIQPSAYAAVEKLSQGDAFYAVHVTKGKPMADSIIGNVKANVLARENTGLLIVYNPELMGRTVTMRFEIESDAAQTFTILSTTETYALALSPGRAWYEVTFGRGEHVQPEHFDAHLQRRGARHSVGELRQRRELQLFVLGGRCERMREPRHGDSHTSDARQAS